MTFARGLTSDKTKAAYQPVGDGPRITLGANSSSWFRKDPRALAYTAGKYAFVAEMLSGLGDVLEIGCGDGFGASILAQKIGHLTATDIYEPHIDEAQACFGHIKNADFAHEDFLGVIYDEQFDGVVALDVLEHVDPEQESMFLALVCKALTPEGVFICGMPTLNSQAHASEHGRAGHINCQHPAQITTTLRKYFANVFSFGMIDGAVNVGPEAMRQYQINICTGPKR